MAIATGMILVILAVVDIWKKQVPLLLVLVLGLLLFGYDMIEGTGILELLFGLFPGCAALLLSYLTGGKLGVGDGFVLLALGIGFGWKDVIAIWTVALVLAAVLAAVLLILKKVNRKSELPFLPCIFGGYVVCQWLMG